jgi:hypothetical protein
MKITQRNEQYKAQSHMEFNRASRQLNDAKNKVNL